MTESQTLKAFARSVSWLVRETARAQARPRSRARDRQLRELAARTASLAREFNRWCPEPAG